MVRSAVLANAVATVVAAGYVLCRVLTAAAPQALFRIGQSWFHTFALEPARVTGPFSLGMFVLGLISSVVVSWVGAYAAAELYKRWAAQPV